MIASIQALNAFKQWEKFSSKVYPDSGGNATIGYGNLLHKGPPTAEDRKLVWSEEHAENMLKVKMIVAEQALNKKITVKVNQNQFDALILWVYNCGIGALDHCSWLRELNKGNHTVVPRLMRLWNKETINGELVVSKGLVNRRKFEADLFNSVEGL